MFGGKVPKANREDFKFDKSIFLEDVFVAGSLQKYKARKAFKKFSRKKLNIGPAEPLVFGEVNR